MIEMSQASDVRKLIAKIEAQGGIVSRGSHHWKIKLASGQLVAILPTHFTGEKGRAIANVRAQLRRVGFDV